VNAAAKASSKVGSAGAVTVNGYSVAAPAEF